MAWNNEMTVILRHLIDDVCATVYTDSRLEETIIVAAQLVNLEVDFDKVYTIDIDALILTPDPTHAVRDDAFINLVVLKAACIITSGEAKAHALQAIKIKDGPTEIDTGQRHKALEVRSLQVCEEFNRAKLQYVAGNGRVGQAVLTPFTWNRNDSDVNRGFN